MDRESHRRLSEDLHEFLSSLETGQILVGSVIEWLQEKAHLYLKEAAQQGGKTSPSQQTSSEEDKSFMRLWIYSHHIYSKFKRRDIVDWAMELGLHGFSMPGKPGWVWERGSVCVCVCACTHIFCFVLINAKQLVKLKGPLNTDFDQF